MVIFPLYLMLPTHPIFFQIQCKRCLDAVAGDIRVINDWDWLVPELLPLFAILNMPCLSCMLMELNSLSNIPP